MGKKKRKSRKKKNGGKEEDPDDNHSNNTAKEQLNIIEPKDLISCLPDEILCRIVSFLPFESAVQTTFLSTQWKDLWKKALVLNGTMEDAVVTIFNLLNDDFGDELLHRPRNKWGLQFNLGHDRALFVSITPNNTLHLDFSAAGEQEFPSSFDWFLPLNFPRRDWWQLPSEHQKIMELNPALLFHQQFRIKTLYLKSVRQHFTMPLASLVSKFSILQSLIIEKCNGVESLDVQVAAGLKNLIVLDCPKLQSLSFKATSLKSFRYRGNLVSFRFRESCYCHDRYCDCGSFLNDAMLDFRQGPLTQWTWDFETLDSVVFSDSFRIGYYCDCPTEYKCFISILRILCDVRSLTMCRWFYETSMCKKLTSSGRALKFWYIKELWWIDCSMEGDNINALLCFLKLCPYLEKLYVTIDPKCHNLASTEKFSAKVGRPKELNYLKVVKLEGFADEQKEILLARRLIPLFRGNPVIISKSEGTCLKHLVKVAKLEKKGKYPFRFEVVENVDEIYHDHIHMNPLCYSDDHVHMNRLCYSNSNVSV